MELEELGSLIDTMKKIVVSSNKNPYEMFSISESAVAFNISMKRITRAVNEKELAYFVFDKKQKMLRRKDIEQWIDDKIKVDVPIFRAKNIAVLAK